VRRLSVTRLQDAERRAPAPLNRDATEGLVIRNEEIWRAEIPKAGLPAPRSAAEIAEFYRRNVQSANCAKLLHSRSRYLMRPWIRLKSIACQRFALSAGVGPSTGISLRYDPGPPSGMVSDASQAAHLPTGDQLGAPR
jgi:hypothetical protein